MPFHLMIQTPAVQTPVLHGRTGGTNLQNAFEITCCVVKSYWCQNTSLETLKNTAIKII